MTYFENAENRGHESVHQFYDSQTGLKAIIAIHSTALGPAAGGTRMWQYDNEDDATTDALRLSRGMTYKNAMAGLPRCVPVATAGHTPVATRSTL